MTRQRHKGQGEFDPSQPLAGDHVVIEDLGTTARCLHCQQTLTVQPPAPVSVWVAAVEEFYKIHRHCPDLKG
jgi:hypothetical protein